MPNYGSVLVSFRGTTTRLTTDVGQRTTDRQRQPSHTWPLSRANNSMAVVKLEVFLSSDAVCLLNALDGRVFMTIYSFCIVEHAEHEVSE